VESFPTGAGQFRVFDGGVTQPAGGGTEKNSFISLHPAKLMAVDVKRPTKYTVS